MQSREGQQHMKRCWKCQGSLKAERLIEIQTKVSILQFVCLSCGRLWPAGVKLCHSRRLTAPTRHTGIL